MTLDRDIRVTPDQIIFATFALRSERSRRRRSIEKAEAARAAGAKIQHGTLDEHYRAVAACTELIETLEVARRQMGHQIANALERDRPRAGGIPGDGWDASTISD
jgi:hypothetical protein